MYPFYAFHLRGKKGASLGLSLPGHRINDGQFRRSWNARSTLSSENCRWLLVVCRWQTLLTTKDQRPTTS